MAVESPGGFGPPTTAETVYDAHNPRNPYLMEAMMHLELTFCGYEGTRRMRKAMQTAQLPEPRFRRIEAMSHQVHVTLENNVVARKSFVGHEILHHISEEDFVVLNNDENKVVNFLLKKDEVNVIHATPASRISMIILKSYQMNNCGVIARSVSDEAIQN